MEKTMNKCFIGRAPISARLRRIAAVAAIAGCGFGLSACDKPDWENPEYISKRLVEGDTAERSMALDHLGNLDREEQKKTAAALNQVYLEAGPNQKDVMQILVQLRAPEAKDAYLQEVRENPTGYAGGAAEALGSAKATEALPDLIELYKSTDSNDTKEGLMRAFRHMPDAKLVELLTETLELDVDNNPIALHAYSCEILGDVAEDSPEALDDAAKKALVKAMFLGNMTGQNVSRECGVAIQQLGAPAVPLLVETFEGKNEAVNTLLNSYNRQPEYEFPANRVKSVSAVRLGALKADEAVDVFLEDLNSTKGLPDGITGAHAANYLRNEGQATSEIINALGEMGAEQAVDLLAGVVKNEKIHDEWDEISDWSVELQLRQDAAAALVHLGDREAAGTLLEMAEKGQVDDMQTLAEAAARQEQPMDPLERYQFNWIMAQSYLQLAGSDAADGLKQIAAASENKDPKLKEKIESFLPAAEKAAECLENDDDAAKAECFGEMLADKEDKEVRLKAAFELSRLPAAAASPVVAANLGVDDMETREALTFAGYRVPSEELASAIDENLEKEKSKGKDYELDHYRKKLLRAWLKNNAGQVAQK